jgi:glycerol-3-phosphate cytidylyltransferase
VKRILVDMSVTLIHHGHIRLLKRAKELGTVVVALTKDEEIFKHKGYHPELEYQDRKEILESIKYVDEVVPSNWIIDDKVLDTHQIDLVVHGDDVADSMRVNPKLLVIFPRTEGVSTYLLRKRMLDASMRIFQRESD